MVSTIDGDLHVTGNLTVDGTSPGGSPSGPTVPIVGSNWNFWSYNLFNHQGSLRHYFTNPSASGQGPVLIGGVNSPHIGAVTDPDAVLGLDLTGPFNGGALSVPSTRHVIIFDTADILPTEGSIVASMALNTTGQLITPRLTVQNNTVNGVTKSRLALYYYTNNQLNGQRIGYDVTTLKGGEQITVQMFGLMPNYS